MDPDLSSQITGGILVAATILLGARLALKLWQMGYKSGGLGLGFISGLFWTGYVFASLGLAPW
ncbi:MAG: hypothetical protein CMH11_20450 [Maritimibacter sp.]|nr:hypothetical protein [Maritimibacter sp.]